MAFQLVRKKIYPNPHSLQHKFSLSINSATVNNSTIYPVIMQDEAQGDPNSKYVNPQSASFSEDSSPNCYPDSRVNYCRTNMSLSLTKASYVTDNIENVRVLIAPIQISFLENLTAKDEVSTDEVEDVLELQHETTDRQTYPLWTGTDLQADGTQGDLHTDVPGLTADQSIESVNFDIDKLYDSLQYYTNAGKVKTSIGRLRWFNVSKRRNLRLGVRATSKTKRMNPYTFFGILIHAPLEGTLAQPGIRAGDASAAEHIVVSLQTRYNEWNENFNMMR